ncbi:hypothetical protein ACEUBY_17625, partial [Aeromonas caviae]|uniref:hypothetical protein n=1 Tax=Aeromonas caviae TaxID=648 RepID=UPI0038D25202
GESKRCLPSKLSFCSQNPWPHTFRKWCSQIPESLFKFTGIRNACTSAWKHFIADVERVMSLCSRDWIKLT